MSDTSSRGHTKLLRLRTLVCIVVDLVDSPAVGLVIGAGTGHRPCP